MPNQPTAPKKARPKLIVPREPRAQKLQKAALPAVPAEKDYTPKKAVQKQLARRRIIVDSAASASRPTTRSSQLHARGYKVTERTMIDEKMAVMSAIKDYYGRDAKEPTVEIVAQQDAVIYQLQIASDKNAERGEKISALAKKNDVLNGNAKLLGLIKDKQEITGSVMNHNINDSTTEEIAAFNDAAPRRRRQRVDDGLTDHL